ncbi:phosphotriesterase [Salegentibacter sp. JZCK2]|uniref:phosphotriesterase family protein n=1 Tax=Salegentibacter tibetensis TaxID=2873600 RepID=UPI001CCAA863|nr:phosphotriesterase [Salegentibacter tibetensis]MBZ9730188.1 phosphotriesterase [Salegentibacter tibetensis]
MENILKINSIIFLLLIGCGCSSLEKRPVIQDVKGEHKLTSDKIWLSHEHILVDFIGADSIQPDTWNHDSIIKEVIPYFEELKDFNVNYFVDATPNYLGRDVILLEKITKKTGVRIITNTGLYGARNNEFIPQYAHEMTAEDLAEMWINEYENGIDKTSIKPGFIKISVDNSDTLSTMHQKLVKAAALTHLKTGLTIASHTGNSKGLWPQLKILKENGVSPESFIWVHAQAEDNNDNYLKAAEMGCWISLDGIGWELEKHIEKILFAKRNGILNRILISHDSGWYDPQKEDQAIKPFTNIFKKLFPELKSQGFTDDELRLLISVNPSKAFSIEMRNTH